MKVPLLVKPWLYLSTILKQEKKYVIDTNLHPQTVDVMRSRANNIGVELVELPLSTKEGIEELTKIIDGVSGALVQYPDTNGEITDYSEIAQILHANKGLLAMATDLLALTVLKPPSEFGADIALGTSQRFGVPFGYGGPHAAFSQLHLNMQEKSQEELLVFLKID